MQFKNLALAASVVATAAAAPAADSCSAPASTPSSTPGAGATQYFGVIAIHSGSGVQNAGFSAAQGSLIAGLQNKGSSCQETSFYINDGVLNIYDNTARPQKVYVDRSGMGQGKIGYTVGVEPAPKNAERKGWAIKDGHLQFDGSDLIACPAADGYSIWANAGVANPAGNKDCVGIAARIMETKTPKPCWAN
ncbi:hypothetical protein BDV32DRAFT_117448 [Aspergillus pseudonomiae]|uniref:Uncharacterized protein n=1 Tax=Aspergillus pseudonomiae TaxID=1506151 RepID=A0A5N7D7G8_9EURO|nr:uncharacterized protein BDV37DRAFT_253803 [Aspergillus pseudonomiae]KAB8264742.1 hypothetical protein BDV32DRAFT_117448 [Aspergillus pseudonomiae]KAE8401893.1 hypothetical protein BDV37DRAFT_253803 [Aspergillus pseudonomiae]